MTDQIVIAPFLVAFITAIGTLATRKLPRAQNIISFLGGTTFAGLSIALLLRTQETVLTYQLSSWPAPYGISFVADPLAGFMIGLTAVVALPSLIYSLKYMDRFAHSVSYQPLFHFMTAGVTGAFLTGDLFNLFVWFEVMLMSSYILVAFYDKKEQTLVAFRYVVINLIGSAMMLVAIGGIYASTGTLNMADLARRLAEPAAYNVAVEPVLGFSAILFCVFALKAGLAPFQFWVPEAYHSAPAPVSAMLAGAVKKVGLYAMIRLYLGIFSTAELSGAFGITSFGELFGPLMMLLGGASILIGGFGAASRQNIESMLAYSSIGQIGFTLLPIGVAALRPELAPLAVTAALVFSLNHAISKSMLFLIAGNIKKASGSTEYANLGGLAEKMPVNAIAFLIGGLSLIGIPPLLGFFGKLVMIKSSVPVLPVVGMILVGSVLTIYYISSAWNSIFWGESVRVRNIDSQLVVPVVFLATLLVVLGIGSELVLGFAESASSAAISTEIYVESVLEARN